MELEPMMVVDKYRFFDEYSSFVRFFRIERDKEEPRGLVLVDRFSKFVDNLSDADVVRLLFYFYKMKPTCADQAILRMGAKRAIQTRFYKYLYNHDISDSITQVDHEYLVNMGIADGSNVTIEPIKNEYVPNDVLSGIIPEVHVELLPEKPKVKKRNRKNRLSIKAKKMSLEELLAWAVELGVQDSDIKKYKEKGTGFLRMGVVNYISKALRKADKFEWFGFDEKPIGNATEPIEGIVNGKNKSNTNHEG